MDIELVYGLICFVYEYLILINDFFCEGCFLYENGLRLFGWELG